MTNTGLEELPREEDLYGGDEIGTDLIADEINEDFASSVLELHGEI
jgi:hypothetical protein